ncbi:hypothetical protein K435DRAFT_690978, partial [Dendrothele bispora CBS 962.96]
IVFDTTTCRRHLQAYHSGKYRLWATQNDFLSMLPNDATARRIEEKAASQSTLDAHVQALPERKTVVPYSDALFREAAIEWLTETNQPIEAVEHPKFQNMIQIASRATNGVNIPSRKVTRQAIMDLFKKNIVELRRRLLVSTSL